MVAELGTRLRPMQRLEDLWGSLHRAQRLLDVDCVMNETKKNETRVVSETGKHRGWDLSALWRSMMRWEN